MNLSEKFLEEINNYDLQKDIDSLTDNVKKITKRAMHISIIISSIIMTVISYLYIWPLIRLPVFLKLGIISFVWIIGVCIITLIFTIIIGKIIYFFYKTP